MSWYWSTVRDYLCFAALSVWLHLTVVVTTVWAFDHWHRRRRA